jgi:hypothetical protein
MTVIIVACERGDFWEAFSGLQEQWGYRLVRGFGRSEKIKAMRRMDLIVAEPLDVRLLELVSAGSKRV